MNHVYARKAQKVNRENEVRHTEFRYAARKLWNKMCAEWNPNPWSARNRAAAARDYRILARIYR